MYTWVRVQQLNNVVNKRVKEVDIKKTWYNSRSRLCTVNVLDKIWQQFSLHMPTTTTTTDWPPFLCGGSYLACEHIFCVRGIAAWWILIMQSLTHFGNDSSLFTYFAIFRSKHTKTTGFIHSKFTVFIYLSFVSEGGRTLNDFGTCRVNKILIRGNFLKNVFHLTQSLYISDIYIHCYHMAAN